MSDLKLTQQQRNFFDMFGYLSFPGLLNHRIDKIIESFEQLFAEKGGGHYGQPHNGKARSCIVPFIDSHEYLCTLLDDPNIHGIFASLLGEDFNYMGSDGNYYVGDTPWHSDSLFKPRLTHIKIALYLDPVGKNSGCLRVIPGSHRIGEPYAEGLQRDVFNPPQNWGIEGKDVPCVALETNPGDVVLFNQEIKHASYHGAARRRMFTINASPRYPDQDIQKLRDYISQGARFWLDRAIGEIMVRTASPQRMRHLEQTLANDGHLAELSAKARKTMVEPSRG